MKSVVQRFLRLHCGLWVRRKVSCDATLISEYLFNIYSIISYKVAKLWCYLKFQKLGLHDIEDKCDNLLNNVIYNTIMLNVCKNNSQHYIQILYKIQAIKILKNWKNHPSLKKVSAST